MNEHTPQGQPTPPAASTPIPMFQSADEVYQRARQRRDEYIETLMDNIVAYEDQLQSTEAQLAEAQQENERLKARITELETLADPDALTVAYMRGHSDGKAKATNEGGGGERHDYTRRD